MDVLVKQLTAAAAEAATVGEKLKGGIAGANTELTQALRKLSELVAQQKLLQNLAATGTTAGQRTTASATLNPTLEIDRLGKQAQAVGKIKTANEEAASSYDALGKRIILLNQRLGESATEGDAATAKQIRNIEKLKAAQAEITALSKQETGLNTRYALLPENSRQRLEEVRDRLAAVNAEIDRGAKNGRLNFEQLFEEARRVTLELQRSTAAEEALGRAAERTAERIQAQAQKIVSQTSEQSRAGLVSQARAIAPGLQGSVSEEEAENRLTKATGAYLSAKRQLEAAVNSGASTERLDQLIGRYEALRGAVAQALAQQNAATKEGSEATLQAAREDTAAAQTRLRNIESEIELERVRTRNRLADFDRENAAAEKSYAIQVRQRNREDAANAPAAGGRPGAFSVESFTNSAASLLRYSVAASVLYGAFNAFQEGAKFVVEFEDSLKELQAISGSTDTQLQSLQKSIVDVANSSKFGTIEITKSAVTLAQAGLSTEDIKNSLKDVVTLATASGESVQSAADVVTSTLSAFQLSSQETSRVTDVIVSGLNRSKLTLSSIASGIQYLGSTAFENNVSLEELVSTLGALANAGLRGTNAATGLRAIIVGLEKPTKGLQEALKDVGLTLGDVDVNVRGLPAVLETLAKSGISSAEAFKSFGTRGGNTFLTLKNNLDVSKQLAEELTATGSAAEASGKQLESMASQWQILKNRTLDYVSAAAQPALDLFKATLKAANELADGIAAAQARYDKLKSEVESGKDSSFGSRLEVNAGKVLDALDPFKGGLPGYLERLATMPKISAEATSTQERLATAVGNTGDAVTTQKAKIESLQAETSKLQLRSKEYVNGGPEFDTIVFNLTKRFEGLASIIARTGGSVYDVINALKQLSAAEKANQIGLLRGAQGAVANQAAAFDDQVGSQVGALPNSLAGLPVNRRNAILTEARKVQAGGDDGVLRDLARGLTEFPAAAKALQAVVNTADQRRGAQLSVKSYDSAIASTQFALLPNNSSYISRLQALTADVTNADSQANGQDQGTRNRLLKGILSQINTQISSAQRELANPKATPEFLKDFQAQFLDPVIALRSQVLTTIKPTKEELNAAKKEATAAAKAERKEIANNKYVDAAEVTAAQAGLNNALTAQKTPDSFDDLNNLIKQSNDALAAWVKEQSDLLEDNIKQRGLSTEQAARARAALKRDVEEKTTQVQNTSEQNITKYIDAFTASVEKRIKENLTLTTKSASGDLSLAQGQEAALSNPLNSRYVPDYTRTLATNRVNVAQQGLNEATFAANIQAIAKYKTILDTLNVEQLKLGGNATTDQIKHFEDEITKTNVQIVTLTNDNVKLQASFAKVTGPPRTLGEGIRQAAAAFQSTLPTGLSFIQTFNLGVSGAFTTAQTSLETFFTSVLSRTASIGQAFQALGASVVQALVQMVAKALAIKGLDFLLHLVGGTNFSGSNIGGSFGETGVSGDFSVGSYDGGPIRRDTGGPITVGVPTRDSVRALLSKGEYVVRRSAVESVGQDFMADLNARGAKALGSMSGGTVINQTSGPSHLNIWMAPPEHQPTMGPGDVLLAINNDILRGGQTKQLIRQVALGA